MASQRYRLEIRGAVQGVGFRPTVYRYAAEAGLAGFVTNDSSGLVVEVEGPGRACEDFVSRLRAEPPPAAAVREFSSRAVDPRGETEFIILPSESGDEPFISIPPDLNVCPDCRRDMADPSDRRYRYPFTNCTNCGPRYTITRSMPYDRPGTTMSAFEMCPECSAEYGDPLDRRFHAQPVACPRCGPRVWIEWADRKGPEGEEAVAAARALLAGGGILALRGLGGFHLACDADNDSAVRLLRERKKRPAKPFALMCASLERAELLADLSGAERAVLKSVRRPIVLARVRDADLAARVAPDNGRLGIMLPYTPLHYLLFAPADGGSGPPPFRVLVMTSGNRRDEPISRTNEEAMRRLSGIADAWLLHDREIHNRADDSIVCVAGGHERVFRRARGYVPRPVRVVRDGGATVLGVGAEVKGGFCLLRGEQAYNSQYLGELSEAGNVEFYRESLARMIDLLGDPPAVIARDMHPDYFTTRLARTWPAEMPRPRDLPPARRVVSVQHHHAHALSVLAELGDGAPETSLAIVLDGTGWGPDGTSWGGEFLLLEDRGRRWSRRGHLRPFELPGGDRAVLEPWRQALALLRRAFDRKIPGSLRPELERCAGGASNLEAVEIMIDGRLNSPPSSGAGRLFDAVGYLLAGRDRISFEAQAAMEVEALACRADGGVEPYPFEIREGPEGALPTLDPAPAVRAIVEDLTGNRPRPEMAAAFQAGLAESCAELAARLLASAGAKSVLLSGGCFQNALLLEATAAGLEARGLNWYSNREVPVNDGGVALGQVAAAAWNPEG